MWTTQTIQRLKGQRTIMVGRPRKQGKRQPNGQPARVYTNPRKQVANQPHRCDMPKRFRESQEAGTRFGRMLLTGRITRAQYTAGSEYARLVDDYRRAVFAPAPNPAAIDRKSVV